MGKAKMGSPKGPNNQKKQKSEASSSKGPAVPSAADLGSASVGSGASGGATEVQDATLHVYELDFCADGSVYGDHFEGAMVAVHLMYFLYPSLMYQVVACWKEYRGG